MMNVAEIASYPYREDIDDSTMSVLADMIHKLRLRSEAALGQKVLKAAVSTPSHIDLSYKETTTILDRLAMGNVMHSEVWGERYSGLISTAAAFAGSGMGLCKDYQDGRACERQEACFKPNHLLHIDLADTGLSGAIVTYIKRYWDAGSSSTFLNASLGTGSLANTDLHPSQSQYWLAVGQVIRNLVTSLKHRITLLILTGPTASDPEFRASLKDALIDLVPSKVRDGTLEDLDEAKQDLTDNEPLWLTAQGAAEIAKRRQEGPFRCHFRPEGQTEEDERRELLEMFKRFERESQPLQHAAWPFVGAE